MYYCAHYIYGYWSIFPRFLVNCAPWCVLEHIFRELSLKGTDHAGTFMSLKCVVYYANYHSWHQSSKIQVVSYCS